MKVVFSVPDKTRADILSVMADPAGLIVLVNLLCDRLSHLWTFSWANPQM